MSEYIAMNAEVASSVLASFGGANRLSVMIGAKNFVFGEDYVSFRLPSNFAKNGVNYVKIKLSVMDDFSIEFGKIRGMNYKVISEHDGIYIDMIRSLFWDELGLEIVMPRFA